MVAVPCSVRQVEQNHMMTLGLAQGRAVDGRVSQWVRSGEHVSAVPKTMRGQQSTKTRTGAP